MGWLSGWQYRKSHVINPAGGAGTNYQIRVKTHYGTGTDGGEDVYLNSHCRADFGDIRFTKSDGETQLDYWMEEKVDSDYAIFWVEVADDLSTNPATIYIYYGKSDATTTSNGDNTFLLFDHFEGTSLDTSRWTSAGNVQVANSEVTVWSTGASVSKLRSLATWLYNVAMRMKIKYANVNDETGGFRTDTSPFDSVLVNRNSGGFWAYSENEGTATSTAITWDADYHVYDLMWVSSKTKYYKDGSSIAEHTTNVPDESLYARFATYNANTQIVIDWVAVRKYVDPEPSHGSWGSEETPSGATYEIYVDAVSQSFATPTPQCTFNIAKDAGVASQSLHAPETTFNISQNAITQALATAVIEIVTGVIEIFKDAIATAQASLQTETTFNITTTAVAQALASALHELGIAKDAIVKASATGAIEVAFALPLTAIVNASATHALESTFNINPEATVKVQAEVAVVKPGEIKVTKLFLIVGDLAIQIQGS